MINKEHYSLLSHNTFGLNVEAARYIEYNSEEELQTLISEKKIVNPFLHIGEGSNLLFTHEFYNGIILHSAIKGIIVLRETTDNVLVRVGAGENWDEWVNYCALHHWYGIENLSLIPGEVGAAAVQNIGAYGVECKDCVSCVETVNLIGQRRIYNVSECEYSYRQSLFKRADMKGTFVIYVQFNLSKKEKYKLDYGSVRSELQKYPEINLCNVRNAVISIRQQKLPDPKIIGSAGSFFMNPIVSRNQFLLIKEKYQDMPFYDLDVDRVKIPAGWMIEQCGWKGKSMGHVGVYSKQALVLINKGGATGEEVVALSKAIARSVVEKFGIEINTEVNFV